MAAEIFVQEFLYRGQPSDNAVGSSFHVVLGAADTDAFGNEKISLNGPMTPDQAAAQGYPLPALLAAINAGLLSQVTALQAEVAALQSQLPGSGTTAGQTPAQP